MSEHSQLQMLSLLTSLNPVLENVPGSMTGLPVIGSPPRSDSRLTPSMETGQTRSMEPSTVPVVPAQPQVQDAQSIFSDTLFFTQQLDKKPKNPLQSWMSQSPQGGQGTVIPLSQPILQSAWLPSSEEMPFEVVPRTPSSRLQLSNPKMPPVPSCHSHAATSPCKTLLAPHVVASRPEADLEDFSQRLKISHPPHRHHHIKQTQQGKTNMDPIPNEMPNWA
ncbi:hypothetical protein CY34DRAFT_19040 [Suillus luteus UH-Slu-Lm8-n1]|uniref:Uncharacterized protein n=1 Tax=Suillus luteus UH-Slu-Lm8-n1 TaxID=930992 RepID=A0A0D0AE26_9AGAM|nr:hypothetical protein CY34DRAFT_19040 [Suillus luteus UH-Slu-Lm8-n1]